MSKKSKKKIRKLEARKKYLDKYIHRKQLSLDNLNYGLHRLDLLIISISGAGIYACLETSKFLIEQKKDLIIAIEIPAFLFIIAIIANLISQFTGVRSNKFDYSMCNKQIDCNGKLPVGLSKTEIDKLDKKSQRFDDITNYLNLASLALLIVGLIFLTNLYSKIIL